MSLFLFGALGGINYDKYARAWETIKDVPVEAPSIQPAATTAQEAQSTQTTIKQPLAYIAPNSPQLPQVQNLTGQGVVGNGVDGASTAEESLLSARNLLAASAVSTVASSLTNVLSARSYRKDVQATKNQYENQKKVIDSNIEYSEAYTLGQYEESMAQLDAYSAANNVDLTSGALQSIKTQGLMDMSSDFAAARTQADLNKKALDLDYALKVSSARKQERNAFTSSAVNLGTSALSFLGELDKWQ